MAKWIAKSIKRPGALTRKAKGAGYKSPRAYCRSLRKNGGWKKGVRTRTKRQCNLAKTLRSLRK